jgi:hypothetical protein
MIDHRKWRERRLFFAGKTRHVTEGDEYPWARGLGNFRCRCNIRIANVQTPSDGILKIKPNPNAVGTVCSAGETIAGEDHDSRTWISWSRRPREEDTARWAD